MADLAICRISSSFRPRPLADSGESRTFIPGAISVTRAISFTIFTAVAMLPFTAASGQQSSASTPATPPSASATAMHKLDFMLGDWEGDGWIVMGPGERRTFHQTETIRTAAGGTVLIIDGLGKGTDPGREGAVVHQAFAIVSYDSATAAFKWRAFIASGQETVATPEIADHRLVWGMDVGPAAHASHIRFTIQITPEGTWHEVGDFLPPGAASDAAGTRFFEMTLRRSQPR
jgi:hypothetical protein